jgi:hypothetical protein
MKAIKQHGKGKKTWANGNVYEGDYKDGYKHGKGKYTCMDGWMDEGDWENDEFIG